MLDLPNDTLTRLARLRAKPKFHADPAINFGLYTGVLDEAKRVQAEHILNDLIDRISQGIAANPTKRFVLDQFEVALEAFDLFDTEDRERACAYLEEIMDCVGLASSDGLLNTWLYGFDPKEPL